MNCNHRLVSEGFDQLDLLSGERFDFQSINHKYADQLVVFYHRDAKYCSDRVNLLRAIRILGIRQNVWNVYRASLQGSPRRATMSARRNRISPYEIQEFSGRIVGRGTSQDRAVETEDERLFGFAEPGCRLDQDVKHRLQIE